MSVVEGRTVLSFESESRIDRAFFGLLIFLGTEVMFFAGLISAFLILRAGSPAWPPPGQPRLPVLVAGINTLVLLLSGYTAHRAVHAIRTGNQKTLVRWLAMTSVLGVMFLAGQGSEWVRLIHYGLTATSSLYGGIFYTVIGCHGLHVFVGMIVLLVVLGRAMRQRYSIADHTGVVLCRLYWSFVVGIWPVLYVLVYLN